MSGPGPDEKVCPYCAEVIRAAAIKCRYCHSDLPEHETEPAPVEPPPPVVEPVETPAPARAEPTPDRTGDPVVRGLALLCAVLALVLVGGLVFQYLTARPDDLRTADSGQVTAPSFRSAAMSAASADAKAILSYSYKTLAEDQETAKKLLTDDFADEYADVMADAGSKALSAKLTQTAEVKATALKSITERRAVVLLFVSTVTTAEGSSSQQLMQNRVRMTLDRKDGDWAVSEMVRF